MATENFLFENPKFPRQRFELASITPIIVGALAHRDSASIQAGLRSITGVEEFF